MSGFKETSQVISEVPSLLTSEVLADASSLPLEDVAGRQEILRLEKSKIRQFGAFRYDLLLSFTKEDKLCITLKLAASETMGVNFDDEQEVAFTTKMKGRNVALRTGYVQISNNQIKEIRPISLFRESTSAMKDILGLHYPNHELMLREVENYSGHL